MWENWAQTRLLSFSLESNENWLMIKKNFQKNSSPKILFFKNYRSLKSYDDNQSAKSYYQKYICTKKLRLQYTKTLENALILTNHSFLTWLQ